MEKGWFARTWESIVAKFGLAYGIGVFVSMPLAFFFAKEDAKKWYTVVFLFIGNALTFNGLHIITRRKDTGITQDDRELLYDFREKYQRLVSSGVVSSDELNEILGSYVKTKDFLVLQGNLAAVEAKVRVYEEARATQATQLQAPAPQPAIAAA